MRTFLSRPLRAVLSGFAILIMVLSYQGAADNVMSGGTSCPRARVELPREVIQVDLPHIFCGVVNRHGKPVGYHHRHRGEEAATARLGRVIDRNPATGVYMGEGIEVWNGEAWIAKRGISTFFPDSCSIPQVLHSIQYAAEHVQCRYGNGRWSGPSAPEETGAAEKYCLGEDGSTLVIQGYFRRQERFVATAWPLVGDIQGNCIATK